MITKDVLNEETIAVRMYHYFLGILIRTNHKHNKREFGGESPPILEIFLILDLESQ